MTKKVLPADIIFHNESKLIMHGRKKVLFDDGMILIFNDKDELLESFEAYGI